MSTAIIGHRGRDCDVAAAGLEFKGFTMSKPPTPGVTGEYTRRS